GCPPASRRWSWAGPRSRRWRRYSWLLLDPVGDLEHLILVLDRLAGHLVAALGGDQLGHVLGGVDVGAFQGPLLQRGARGRAHGTAAGGDAEQAAAVGLQLAGRRDVDQIDLPDRLGPGDALPVGLDLDVVDVGALGDLE